MTLQTDGLTCEVIVVDDGSPRSPQPIFGARVDRLPVRLVEQGRVGPGGARNAGAAVARGRYLAFLDDDCRPAADWLAVLARELERHPAQLLGGRVENALTDNAYSEASEWIGQFVYAYNQRPSAREPFFTTNNIAMATALFHEVGGFTVAIPSATAEDKDFCDRWRARGFTLRHAPSAVVYHAHELTLWRFVQQHFNYGRGILAFRLLRRHRAEETGAAAASREGTRAAAARLVPEPLRFYAELVLSPLQASQGRWRWRLVALLVVSQAATVLGAAHEVLQWRHLARVRAGVAGT